MRIYFKNTQGISESKNAKLIIAIVISNNSTRIKMEWLTSYMTRI